MPSAAYSSCSAAKTCWLKVACSFSFAKLISSCSSELREKASNPKMSSSPMVRLFPPPSAAPAPAPIFSLMRPKIQSNSEPYSAFASASRATAAFSGGCGTATTGNLPTFLMVSAVSSSSGEMSRTAAAALSDACDAGDTHDPSSALAISLASKARLPRVRMPARTRRKLVCSASVSWKVEKAAQTARQSAASSMPGTESEADWPR
mmetsp:Transcript_13326/g.44460  ORF Transcript_13326/g.44460 Transcript_13326/m.44460 type:complete len:206 (+) Transcript_13326:484-1101(+)